MITPKKIIYHVQADNGRSFVATLYKGNSTRDSKWKVEVVGLSETPFECTQRQAFNYEEAVYRACLHYKIAIPELKDFDE